MATDMGNYEKYGGGSEISLKGIVKLEKDDQGIVGLEIPGVLSVNNLPEGTVGSVEPAEGNILLWKKDANVYSNTTEEDEIPQMLNFGLLNGYLDYLYYHDFVHEEKKATITFLEDADICRGVYEDTAGEEVIIDIHSHQCKGISDNCTARGYSQWEEYPSMITISHLASTIESIGKNAFYKCSSLTITDTLLPASLKTIGESAFEDCTSLGTLHAEQCTNLTTIETNAFNGANGTIYFGETIFDNLLSQGRIIHNVGTDQYTLDSLVAIRISSN